MWTLDVIIIQMNINNGPMYKTLYSILCWLLVNLVNIMAPYFVPMAFEPKLSTVRREKLELRLQEWQAQQDLLKGRKTQNHMMII